MPSLLLVLALLAADADLLLVEINLARLDNGVPLVEHGPILQRAAELEAEWLHRFGVSDEFPPHLVGSKWLRKRYPKLLWSRLEATYGGNIPALIGSHDLARLCGWAGGQVSDIIGEGRLSEAEFVSQWLRTPHRLTLLGDYDVCGTADKGEWVVATFGKE